jgi:hypothetical protein
MNHLVLNGATRRLISHTPKAVLPNLAEPALAALPHVHPAQRTNLVVIASYRPNAAAIPAALYQVMLPDCARLAGAEETNAQEHSAQKPVHLRRRGENGDVAVLVHAAGGPKERVGSRKPETRAL